MPFSRLVQPSNSCSFSIDDSRVMDSTAALDLPDIPKSLLVVGGGYIGPSSARCTPSLGSAVNRRRDDTGLLPAPITILWTY